MSIQLSRPALIAFIACVLIAANAQAEKLRVKDAEAAYDRGLYAEALHIARPLAEQGNSRAQYLLSLMYKLGRGVTPDRCESTIWADKAARQGHPGGQYSMAWAHFSGHGIPRNDEMAYRWALSAQRAGDKLVAEDLEMFGSGLSEAARRQIKATMKDWRAQEQKPVKVVRPPTGWLRRALWRLRGGWLCKDW
jgi:TPR repeat protein